MPRLPAAIFLAQKMGKSLGGGALLQRCLQEKEGPE